MISQAHRDWIAAFGREPMALTEFLLARIAEDEAVARAVPDYPGNLTETGSQAVHEHVERWKVARVLAECAGKRLTVRFLSDLERGNYDDPVAGSIAYSVLCRMADVYADHPDYREEWKP